MRKGLTYLGQSHRLCRNIRAIEVHVRSRSQRVGNWDAARVFMAKLQVSVLGMCCPRIEVLTQLRYAIQSIMTFLDLYRPNFGELWLIINVSFQLRHATISHWSMCTPLHSALFHFSSLQSHLVFFSFDSVDAVHTDYHISGYCTFRCWRIILLGFG